MPIPDGAVIQCRKHGFECAMPDGDVRDVEFSEWDDESGYAWDVDVGLPLTNADPDDEED